MNAVVALGMGRSIAAASLRAPATALLLCVLAFSAAAAGDEPGNILLAQVLVPMSGDRLRPQLEVSATSLPRFDSTDGTTQSSRIDMSVLAPRQSTLGPSLAMTSTDARNPSGGRPFAGGTTSVDLGLRWRYTSDSNYRFDVTAWRRMNPVDAASLIQNRESSYGARVEMRVASAPQTGFVADRGFLGFQLESGARITLRKGGAGKPMVYYRNKF